MDHLMKPLAAHFRTRLLRILCWTALLLSLCAARASVIVTSLHSFAVATNGIYPEAALVQGSDGSFYGTTANGGVGNAGTVFRLAFGSTSPPQLNLGLSGSSVILSWPANGVGFVLQSATTLANGGDWQDSNLTPTIVSVQNVVTLKLQAQWDSSVCEDCEM